MNLGHKKFYNLGTLASESLTLDFDSAIQILLLHTTESSIDYEVL